MAAACTAVTMAIPASASGNLDPTFGNGGLVLTKVVGPYNVAHAIALDAGGRIVAAGTVERTATGWDFGLVRYAADGSLDPTFGFGGRVTTDFGIAGREDKTDEAFAVAIQPDGKIVAAGGTGRCGTSNGYAALARYGSDGALDSSFGEGGLVYTDFLRECDAFNAVAVQQDGKIVAAGFTGQGGVGQDRAFLVARYDADGGLDPTFGSGGSVLTDFGSARFDEARAVVLQPDGKVLAAGFSSGAREGEIALARYLSDGQLDPRVRERRHGDDIEPTPPRSCRFRRDPATRPKDRRGGFSGWVELGRQRRLRACSLYEDGHR